MENDQFERIERLLSVIAHELYLARRDHEFESAPKGGNEGKDLAAEAQRWREEERAWLANYIDHMREIVDQSTRKDMRYKD